MFVKRQPPEPLSAEKRREYARNAFHNGLTMIRMSGSSPERVAALFDSKYLAAQVKGIKGDIAFLKQVVDLLEARLYQHKE